jgi:putative ABC transport system permease protein
MDTFWQDLKYGIRMLAKSPGFTAIAILTLALGIGANTAIFSVVNAELLRPLPFRDSSRLASVATSNARTHSTSGAMSYPDFLDLQAQNQVFVKMAAYTDGSFTLTGVAQPAHIVGSSVSASLFDVLGVAPELGRTFLPDEDQPHHHAVIISHQLWVARFAGDPHIIGREITLDKNAYSVVGVMPPSFQYPLQRKTSTLWTTMAPLLESADNQPTIAQERGAHFLRSIARLKPGVSVKQAQAGMDVIMASLSKQYPDTNKHWGAHVVSEQYRMTRSIRPALFLMMIAVGFVLLIACVNVANLLLARATARAREIAIRAALGAGRNRLVKQLLTESFLLALIAGGLGLLLARWGSEILVRMSAEQLPRSSEIHVDGPVMAFTLGIAVLTGVLFGLAPALHVSHANIVDSLKEGALSTTASKARFGLRSSLVVVEMALALVLLVSAGLLIRSLMRMQQVNPGFDAQNVMTASIDVPDAKYSDPQKAEFFRILIPKLGALAGVQSAAAVYPLPMSGDEMRTTFEIEGRPVPQSEEPASSLRDVTPNYFATMRIPLLQGRDFDARETAQSGPVVIVNEALARQYFPGESALGKHIKPGISSGPGEPLLREIVGVVGNVKFSDLTSEWMPESYLPSAQLPFGSMTLVTRSAQDPHGVAKMLKATVQSMDPDIPTYAEKAVEEYLDGALSVPRFNTSLLALFAALAMLLTSVGLYGVISYSVVQRTHEIGIRMALGAKPRDMMSLIVGQGLRLGLLGVGIGFVVALGLTHFLSSLLFGVTATDPLLSFAGVIFLLLVVVMMACYVPARRAMRVDPMIALRHE